MSIFEKQTPMPSSLLALGYRTRPPTAARENCLADVVLFLYRRWAANFTDRHLRCNTGPNTPMPRRTLRILSGRVRFRDAAGLALVIMYANRIGFYRVGGGMGRSVRIGATMISWSPSHFPLNHDTGERVADWFSEGGLGIGRTYHSVTTSLNDFAVAYSYMPIEKQTFLASGLAADWWDPTA